MYNFTREATTLSDPTESLSFRTHLESIFFSNTHTLHPSQLHRLRRLEFRGEDDDVLETNPNGWSRLDDDDDDDDDDSSGRASCCDCSFGSRDNQYDAPYDKKISCPGAMGLMATSST
jgi:hypothetical protein